MELDVCETVLSIYLCDDGFMAFERARSHDHRVALPIAEADRDGATPLPELSFEPVALVVVQGRIRFSIRDDPREIAQATQALRELGGILHVGYHVAGQHGTLDVVPLSHALLARYETRTEAFLQPDLRSRAFGCRRVTHLAHASDGVAHLVFGAGRYLYHVPSRSHACRFVSHLSASPDLQVLEAKLRHRDLRPVFEETYSIRSALYV